MAAQQPFLLRNHDVLGYSSKNIEDMEFIHAQKVGFGGMQSPMVIFPLMSNSKWPPGSHFYCAMRTFWPITAKLLVIWCMLCTVDLVWGYARSNGHISGSVKFKKGCWNPFCCAILPFWTLLQKYL